MFEKIRLSSAALIAVLSVSGAVVVAQDQQPPTTGTPQIQKQNRGDRLERRGKRREMRGQRLGAGLRGLDLTDQQREQARAIMRANFESHKAQIEELKQLRQKGRDGLSDADKARAKELHNQLRESRMSARNQLSSLLTTEQKIKLEERMKNRRERRERYGRKGMNRPI
ncbi:MAG TPA: Spy/CpxP family protein refolding chaperone [Pyrinomonadaceae bacterium]|nr:Spy/CpxP family protein refolding chaperone [Pyrinomonadaceae bacterium]